MNQNRSIRQWCTIVSILMLASLSSCSDNSSGPAGPRYTVSGYVILKGVSRDLAGNPLGAIVLDNVSGVRVRLLRNGSQVAQAQTVNGRYIFRNIPAGDYRAFSWVTPTAGDSTSMLTVVDTNLVAADTLTLDSMGALIGRPNPTDSISFLMYDQTLTAGAALDILTPDLAQVATVLDPQQVLPVGPHEAKWDGKNNNGRMVAPGAYWAIYFSAGAYKNELIVHN